MMEIKKTVLGSEQIQKCVDGDSSVSSALLALLKNYKVFFFEVSLSLT